MGAALLSMLRLAHQLEVVLLMDSILVYLETSVTNIEQLLP